MRRPRWSRNQLYLALSWFYKTSAPQKLVLNRLNRLNSAKVLQIHRFTLAKDYLLYVLLNIAYNNFHNYNTSGLIILDSNAWLRFFHFKLLPIFSFILRLWRIYWSFMFRSSRILLLFTFSLGRCGRHCFYVRKNWYTSKRKICGKIECRYVKVRKSGIKSKIRKGYKIFKKIFGWKCIRNILQLP